MAEKTSTEVSDQIELWKWIQDRLKNPAHSEWTVEKDAESLGDIKYVAGMDISFFINDETRWVVGLALFEICATCSTNTKDDTAETRSRTVADVLQHGALDEDVFSLRLVDELYEVVPLTVPYVPGFLGFREYEWYEAAVRRLQLRIDTGLATT